MSLDHTSTPVRPQSQRASSRPDDLDDAALLAHTVERIADPARTTRAQDIRAQMGTLWNSKVKPLGSLGVLEELTTRIACIRGTTQLGLGRPAAVVCAADHGLAAESVSAYPPQVTALMLDCAVSGGAAVSVLARAAGAELILADLGVGSDYRNAGVRSCRIAAGTHNSALGQAMTPSQVLAAIAQGIRIADELADSGFNLVALGEMGIGNTATAAAMTGALLHLPAEQVCGPGTGMYGDRLAHKTQVVARVLQRHADAREPLDVLAAMGGFEIAALVGVTLGCASRQVPVIVDGFITGAAALVAAALAPASTESMLAAHLSGEPGHGVQLAALGLDPLLEVGMRLGEATGALVAIAVVNAALTVFEQMATYASLGLGEQ